jgi:hypothetical protein
MPASRPAPFPLALPIADYVAVTRSHWNLAGTATGKGNCLAPAHLFNAHLQEYATDPTLASDALHKS